MCIYREQWLSYFTFRVEQPIGDSVSHSFILISLFGLELLFYRCVLFARRSLACNCYSLAPFSRDLLPFWFKFKDIADSIDLFSIEFKSGTLKQMYISHNSILKCPLMSPQNTVISCFQYVLTFSCYMRFLCLDWVVWLFYWLCVTNFLVRTC